MVTEETVDAVSDIR